MEYKNFTPCMNCFVHPSVQVPLNVEVPPEMSGNYSVSFINVVEYYNTYYIYFIYYTDYVLIHY